MKALISEALGQPIESVFTRFDEVGKNGDMAGGIRRGFSGGTVGSEIV